MGAKLRDIEEAGGPKVMTLAESIRQKIERSENGTELLSPEALESQEALRLAEEALAEQDKRLR